MGNRYIADFEKNSSVGASAVKDDEWPDIYTLLGLKNRQDVDQPKSCEPERKKRFRTIFTPFQLAGLEREYRLKKYLDKFRRALLARHLNVPEKQIKVWFQNRRMRDKKKNDSTSTASSPPLMTVQQAPQHLRMDQNCFQPIQNNVNGVNIGYFSEHNQQNTQFYYQQTVQSYYQQNIQQHNQLNTQPHIQQHIQHNTQQHNQENIQPQIQQDIQQHNQQKFLPNKPPQNYTTSNEFAPCFWQL